MLSIRFVGLCRRMNERERERKFVRKNMEQCSSVSGRERERERALRERVDFFLSGDSRLIFACYQWSAPNSRKG